MHIYIYIYIYIHTWLVTATNVAIATTSAEYKGGLGRPRGCGVAP